MPTLQLPVDKRHDSEVCFEVLEAGHLRITMGYDGHVETLLDADVAPKEIDPELPRWAQLASVRVPAQWFVRFHLTDGCVLAGLGGTPGTLTQMTV